jgi:hypothetical protein
MTTAGPKEDVIREQDVHAGEQPRVLFLHDWGVGPARDLARGLRSGLEGTATRLGKG